MLAYPYMYLEIHCGLHKCTCKTNIYVHVLYAHIHIHMHACICSQTRDTKVTLSRVVWKVLQKIISWVQWNPSIRTPLKMRTHPLITTLCPKGVQSQNRGFPLASSILHCSVSIGFINLYTKVVKMVQPNTDDAVVKWVQLYINWPVCIHTQY